MATTIARHDDMRRNNRRLVLDALRRRGALSRTDICLATGLSPATVSAFAAALIAEGVLVDEGGPIHGAARRGRPQTGLALNPAAATVLTLTMSVDAVRAAVFDYAGNRRGGHIVTFEPTVASESDLVARTVEAGGTALAAAAGCGPLRGVVVGIQGMADAQSRRIQWSPFTPVRDLPLADVLERAFGAPTALVHDCAMIVESLRRRDPGRHGDDFVAILQAEGIGMGLFLKGAIFSGARSSAGEFGHMIVAPGGARCRCGRRGCIEAYASNYAIWRAATGGDRDRVPDHHFSASEMAAIANAARAGEGPARAAYREAGQALGLGLGNLFALTDPLSVSIVGSGAMAFDLYEPALRETIAAGFSGEAGARIAISTYPDDQDLTEDGCRLRALGRLDREIFSIGELAGAAQ